MALLSVSCQSKPMPDDSPEEQSYTVTLEAGFEALTRADVSSETGVITWSGTDRIAVGLDDGTFVPFDLVSGAGETSASFSGTVPGGKTVSGKAYYPWWEGAYSVSEPRITPPDTQDYVSDTYAPAVMSADIVPGSPLSFKHEGGVMRFTIKGIPSSAVKFTFSSDDGVYGNDDYSITFPAGGSSTRVFSVPVRAGALTPYTISLYNSAGGVMISKSKASSTNVERSQLRNVTPLEVTFSNNFRIVSYNVLDGMENDYDNNYDNFVSWVRSVSPDVLVLCEAKPFNKSEDEKNNASFFRSKMVSRAARWGHSHVAIVNKDRYPVVITSSSAITLKGTFDNSKTAHGALYVSTHGYEIVGLHLQPTSDQDYETYGTRRLEEFNYILNGSTKAYPAVTDNWIFAGDFNSYSPLERDAVSPFNGYSAYKYSSEDSNSYAVYNKAVEEGLTDVLYSFNGRIFQPTMFHGRSRIDYFFVSPDVYSRVKRAEVLRGGFPGDYSSAGETPNPSDHFPILMDIADYSFRVLDGSTSTNDWDEEECLAE
ncbi:MAG: hypothetical protein IJ813_00215 [Bacteroidales bacterium]|nr:hypothetical protein [Bacteroidales bacterium]